MGQVNTQSPAILKKSDGSANVGFVRAEAGATDRTAADKFKENISAADFAGATGTIRVQAAIDSLNPSNGGRVFVPAGIQFSLTSLVFPARCELDYMAQDDISNIVGNVAATSERVCFFANSNSGGIVNEHHTICAAFHPGMNTHLRDDVTGHDSKLGSGQSRTRPRRMSWNMIRQGFDMFRVLFERDDERNQFSGVSQHAWLRKITLTNIKTASFTVQPKVGDRVQGLTSGAVGLVRSISATNMVLQWISGAFVNGETVVNNRGTIDAPNNEVSSTSISAVASSSIPMNPLVTSWKSGNWGVGIPNEAAGDLFTVGGRVASVPTRSFGQEIYEQVDNPGYDFVDSFENVTPAGRRLWMRVLDAGKRIYGCKYGEEVKRAHVDAIGLHVNFGNTVLIAGSSHNVASLTRVSTGIYEIVPSVDFAVADYSAPLSNSSISDFSRVTNKAINKITIKNYNSSWALADLVGLVDVIVAGGDI